MSDSTVIASHNKLSQQRLARQQRKAERQQLRQKKAEFEQKKKESKIIKARFSRKTLSGFLVANADLIKRWLRDYEHLFCLADDYGFQRLDRLPDDKRHQLVQQYVDIAEFIDKIDELQNSINETSSQQKTEQLVES